MLPTWLRGIVTAQILLFLMIPFTNKPGETLKGTAPYGLGAAALTAVLIAGWKKYEEDQDKETEKLHQETLDTLN